MKAQEQETTYKAETQPKFFTATFCVHLSTLSFEQLINCDKPITNAEDRRFFMADLLRHSPRQCLGSIAFQHTRTYAGIKPIADLYFTADMPAKLDSSQLRRRASGEDRRWFSMPAAYVLVCPKNIPGITGGYVAGRSTAYESQAEAENI